MTARTDDRASEVLRRLGLVGPPSRTYERGAEASTCKARTFRQLLDRVRGETVIRSGWCRRTIAANTHGSGRRWPESRR
jgi:hypothetical protein